MINKFKLLSLILLFTPSFAWSVSESKSEEIRILDLTEEESIRDELIVLGRSLRSLGHSIKTKSLQGVNFIRKDSESDFVEVRKKLAKTKKELEVASKKVTKGTQKKLVKAIHSLDSLVKRIDNSVK